MPTNFLQSLGAMDPQPATHAQAGGAPAQAAGTHAQAGGTHAQAARVDEAKRECVLARRHTPDACDVLLTTVCKSKGLEWPVVFAVRLNEGECPLSVKGDAALQEERRLCYVAMSRAKEQLCLTHVAQEASGAPATPSRFLAELPRELLEHVHAFY